MSESNIIFAYDPILGCLGWDFGMIQTESRYEKDKARYVHFNLKAVDKVKLRAYIAKKSLFLSEKLKRPNIIFRDLMIKAYNEQGIEGVDYVYRSFILEMLKAKKNGQKQRT